MHKTVPTFKTGSLHFQEHGRRLDMGCTGSPTLSGGIQAEARNKRNNWDHFAHPGTVPPGGREPEPAPASQCSVGESS